MEIGIKNVLEIKVLESHLASVVGSGEVDVFATPMMIAFMEKTAAESVRELVSEGNVTVGTFISTSHIAATPKNANVRFESVLTEINGKILTFEINAFDEKDKIGEAVHKRAIVNKEKFNQRASQKFNV